MKKLTLILAALCAFALPVASQTYTSTALQNSPGNYARIVPFAPVTVCAISDLNTPCTTKVTTFTDQALGTPCTLSANGIGAPASGANCNNPGIADANGNFSVFLPSGTYRICTFAQNYQCATFTSPSVAAAGLADPGSNGPVFRNALNGTRIAVSADVIALFSGSCDSAHALFGDGTCKTAGAVSSVFGRTGAVVATAGDYTWDQIGAGSNLNAQSMGSGGSFKPLNLGQVAGSQVWMPDSIQAPALAFSTTGGNLVSNHNIHVVVTYNSGLGESLPSLDAVVQTSACVSSQCSVTVTATTLPSGYISYTVYSCDASSAASCVWLKQAASANCVAITGNCVIATVGAGAGVPTINTAFVQPPGVQANPVSIANPQGFTPYWFTQKNDGNYYPLAGIDTAPCTPLPSPCGIFSFVDHVSFNDTGLPFSSLIKNNLLAISHLVGSGTTATNGNDDRAIGLFVNTSTTMTGSSNPRILGIYEETHIKGTPSALSGSGPDTGGFGSRWVLEDDRTGGTLGSPLVGVSGSYQYNGTSPLGSGGSVPYAAIRSDIAINTGSVTATGGAVVAGWYAKGPNMGAGNSGFTYVAAYAEAPTTVAASRNDGFVVGSGWPNGSTSLAIRTDTVGQAWEGEGTLYIPSIQGNASTLNVTGSLGVTGGVTTAQLAAATGNPTCGTAGATAFVGQVVAKDSNGGATIKTAINFTCASDVTATNTLIFQNIQSPGASSYDFYISSASGTCNGGACTLGKVGSCTPVAATLARAPFCPFTYTGTAGDGTTAPTINTTGGVVAYNHGTLTNCAATGTAASPSVASCSAASAGSFSCATNATGATCTVNTTAVTANSQIFVQEDETVGTRLGVTCNTGTNVLPASRLLNARVAGTSFTINLGTVTTNPACFDYFLVN